MISNQHISFSTALIFKSFQIIIIYLQAWNVPLFTFISLKKSTYLHQNRFYGSPFSLMNSGYQL